MSLKLEEKKITIDGAVYPLRCNMSVLERLQDGPGQGAIGTMMEMPTYQAIFEILKAMLDDACEDNPELTEVPMKKLKKLYSPADLGEMGIFRMFVRSLTVVSDSGTVSESDTDKNKAPDNSGN